MSDLTDRLRRHAEWAAQGYDVLFTEAADRIDELEDDARADNALLDWHLANVDKLQARIEELEAALHIPQSCTTVQDLVDYLGERQAYTKIVADSIGHRIRIDELETALRTIQDQAIVVDKNDIARITLMDQTAREALDE